MKTLRKFGAFSALYMAAAYLIGMAIFLAVLDYPSITDLALKSVWLLGLSHLSSRSPSCL